MKFLRKRWKRLGVVLALLLVAGSLMFEFWAPYMIISPRRLNVPGHDLSSTDPFELMEVTVEDSLVLTGIWEGSLLDTSYATIILVHGISNSKEGMAGCSDWLIEAGYSTVAFDNRAHGQSGGEFTTYGYYEKHDMQAIVDEVKRRWPNQKIGIWGNSLGGAISIQTMAIDERIEFGIIESAFSNMRLIVHDYARRFVWLEWDWPINHLVDRAGEIAQFPPDSVRPAVAAAHVDRPVLVIHGDSDDRISLSHGQAIHDALPEERGELYVVKGGGHKSLHATGGQEYVDRIVDFLNRQR